jgi:Domain of unknown function (DUF4386)
MYYYVLFVTRLIPRWLSVWGLAAVALAVVATIYSASTQDFGFTTVNTVLNVPIGLQELDLGVWLIVRVSILRSATTTTRSSIERRRS